MEVSIIIVNYNTNTLLKQCLNSIYQHTKDIYFEIIVIDNASTDSSIEMMKTEFPNSLLIESKENLGFGKANNLGMKYSKGEYIFLLNSDTLLLNNAVKIFFDFIKTNKQKIGFIGSVLLDSSMHPTHSSGSFPSKRIALISPLLGYFTNRFYEYQNRKEIQLYESLNTFREVDYITGADLFVPASLMKESNGFDPAFFMYYEEADLQLRLKELGYKSIILEGPRIIHTIEGSSINQSFSKEKRIMHNKSMFVYFKKHSSLFGYLVFRLFYLVIRLPILFDKRITLKDRLHYIDFLLTYKA